MIILITRLIYQVATDLFSLWAPKYLKLRAQKGKEEVSRLSERYGHPSKKRPNGKLVWIHGASVGESRSAIPLIEALLADKEDWHILVTTGTVASAEMLNNILPKQAWHQYIPLDVKSWVKRFISYWRPDIVLWIEQDLWPNTIYEIHKNQIPMILLNARMSEKTFRRWQWAKPVIQSLIRKFDRCYAQAYPDAERLRSLTGVTILEKGNLKYTAKPLPACLKYLSSLQKDIQDRPIWLAASTHEGEEEIIINAHLQILKEIPNTLCLIVPRHIQRASDIRNLIESHGLAISQRSQQEQIVSQTQVYLADTMGELGIFYRLASIVFIGGSLVPVGGHNFMEAAYLNCAILHGYYMHNYIEMVEVFNQRNALTKVGSSNEIASEVLQLLRNNILIKEQQNAAAYIANNQNDTLKYILDDIKSMISI